MKRILFIALICLKLNMSAHGAEVAGSLPGDLSVGNNGAVSYSIPVSAPPGTAGMAPDIGFLYNSQGSNGAMGKGWAISGLSSITRAPATYFHDYEVDKVDFDSLDRFSLDGQRLIQVGTNEYRTMVESFNRILSSGTHGNGPESFTVQTKSGLKMTYGGTSDSKLVLNGSVYTWYLNRIEDTAGNYITFEYSSPSEYGVNVPCIKFIKYTGHTSKAPHSEIRFHYTSTNRTDRSPVYILGNEIRMDRLLDRVSIYDNDALAWEYQLEYYPETAYESDITKIKSIQYKYGNDALPKTVFTWEDYGTLDFAQGSMQSGYDLLYAGGYDFDINKASFYTYDADGDGTSELLVAKDAYPNGGHPQFGSGDITDFYAYKIFGSTSLARNNLQVYYGYGGYYANPWHLNKLLITDVDWDIRQEYDIRTPYYDICDWDGDRLADFMEWRPWGYEGYPGYVVQVNAHVVENEWGKMKLFTIRHSFYPFRVMLMRRIPGDSYWITTAIHSATFCFHTRAAVNATSKLFQPICLNGTEARSDALT